MSKKKYNFSAFDKPKAEGKKSKYNFAAFDKSEAPAPAAGPGYEITPWDSVKRGAEQGLSFGLADEFKGAIQEPTGALKTMLEVLGANYEQDPAALAYKQERDLAREQYADAEAANPGSYIGGNIAGSIPTAVAGGVGLLGKGVQALSTAKGIMPAIKLGGLTGAATGIGMSESDNLGDMALEAGGSGLLGAGLGGGIAGLGKLAGATKGAVSSIGKSIAESDTGESFLKALGYGMREIDTSSKKGLEIANQRITDIAKKYGFLAKELHKEAGDEIGSASKKINEAGTKFNISEEFNKLKELVKQLETNPNPEAQKDAAFINSYIKNLEEGVIPNGQVLATEYTPQQVIPGKQSSAAQKLADEAAIAQRNAELTGQQLNTDILESTDDEGRKLLSLLKSQDEQIGAAERAVPVLDADGNQIDTLLSPGDAADNFKSKTSAKTIIDQSTPDQVIPAQRGDVIEIPQDRRLNAIDPAAATLKQTTDVQKTLTGFGDVSTAAPSLRTTEARNPSKIIAGEIGKMVDEIPELADAKMRSNATYKALEAMGIGPEDFQRNPFTKQVELTPDAENKLGKIIRRSERDTDTGEDSKKIIERIMGLLGGVDYKKTAPIAKEAVEAADVHDLVRRAQGFQFQNRSTYIKSGAIKLGNNLGFGISKLNKATPDQLKQVAEAAMSMGGAGAKVAKSLSEAVNKDQIGRNAMIFSLQQTPEFRQVLEDLLGKEDAK
jgi:hypothetical protein